MRLYPSTRPASQHTSPAIPPPDRPGSPFPPTMATEGNGERDPAGESGRRRIHVDRPAARDRDRDRVVGIISVPLATVVLGYLRGADATTARLAELRRSIEPTAATRAVTTGEPGAGKLNSTSVTTTSASSWSPLMGDEALFRSLETDASAFVAKTASTAEVLAAIRHAAVATSSFTAAGLAPALAWRRRARQPAPWRDRRPPESWQVG